MSTKHTPEPWILETARVYNPGNEISEELSLAIVNLKDPRNTFSRKHATTDKANAKRIVDCVNAMAGIKDPIEFVEIVRKLELDAYQQVKAERDHIQSELNHWLNEDRKIRELIQADENESTYDEIERLLIKSRDSLPNLMIESELKRDVDIMQRAYDKIVELEAERDELARWKSEAIDLYKPITEFEHPELKLCDSRVETIMRLVAERDQFLGVMEETYELALEAKQQFKILADALKSIADMQPVNQANTIACFHLAKGTAQDALEKLEENG